jgi:hypothetical protein
VLDAKHRLRDAGELAQRIGRYRARTWKQFAARVLPGLAIGIPADDSKAHHRLSSRDGWAAAIVGRRLGLWHGGPPPSVAVLCDALVWRELGLFGKPKSCPPEIRAVFLQRRFSIDAGDAGPPERLVRVLAAREVGASSSELPALRNALMRAWLTGRVIGAPQGEASQPAEQGAPGASRPGSEQPARSLNGEALGEAPSFARDVLAAAEVAREGWFGDRKVFVSAIWYALRRDPRWSAISLDEFKARLVAAHRAGELVLARADFVAAMDPALVAASEIALDGASFHFLVKEPVS